MASMDDLAEPFCVECDNDPDCAQAAIDERFSTLDQAYDYIDKVAGRFSCIWLSELGVYRIETGKIKEDWIYLWWSDQTGWGQLFGRREGYPESRLTILAKYRPIAELEELS